MKQIIPCLLLTVLVIAALFSGCTGQNQQAPASPATAGTPEKTYIVGIDAEYPPTAISTLMEHPPASMSSP